jgi:ribosomal protein S18 acetylase RimI-like enzyme
MLCVRAATQADLPAVSALLGESWHATYDAIMGRERVAAITRDWHNVAALARQVQAPGQVFLVLERTGELLGTSAAGLGPGPAEAALRRLYLRPAVWGQGLGRHLLRATTDHVMGCTSWHLEVEPANARAIAFYTAAGFAVEARADTCNGQAGLASLRMRRDSSGSRAGFPACIVRPVEDRDAQDLFGLLTLCFAQYPGCYMDPHDDMAHLNAPATAARERGVHLEVVEDAGGRIMACCGVDEPEPGLAEVHQFYVRPDRQGQGLGRALMARCAARARAMGAATLIAWSDTRFTRAHSLYERLGFVRTGEERALLDISATREFLFRQPLA